jgi:outer membrane usher protein
MCRPPTSYRWPALVILAVAGLEGAAKAELLPSTPADGGADQTAAAASERPVPSADENQDAGPSRGAVTGQDAPSGSNDGVAEVEPTGPAGKTAVPAGPPGEEERPAFLHLSVNQVDVDDVFVILRGADVLAKAADLQKPGLRIEGGVREKRGEDEMVWLASLSPRVKFTVDERALTLTVTADPKLFEGTVLDLRSKRPEGIVYGTAPSFFLNYLVTGGDLQNGRGARVSGFAESGLSLGGHLLYASGQRSSVDGSWERLLTNMTFDLRHRLTSIVLGDLYAASDSIGGVAMMGGLSVARNFGLDPYYVFLPMQRLTGTALTPSTVEVYVNGQLVRRDSLQPGQFTMQNLPVTSGSGDVRVVVRDAFGATQTIANPYYMALGTLARGLHDFSYNLGFVRQNYGTQSWNYGHPALLLRHRLGLTDWLTVGARVEGTLHMASGGPSLALRLPIGEVGASGAVSNEEGYVGGAGLVSFSYMGKPFYFQTGARYQTRDYANLGIPPSSLPPPNALPKDTPSPLDRQRLNLLTSVAKNIGGVASVSVQYEATNWWGRGWTNQITLMGNRTITKWMYAFATVTNLYQSNTPAQYGTFVGLSFAPADRVTAGVTRSDHWGGSSGYGGGTQATLQRSLPIGPGLGYRLVLAQGENDINQANLRYQGAYGRVEADYQHEGYGSDRGHAALSATGGIVLIGGRPFLTRPVQDSYALIRVPGVGGVHGTMSNQVVGTTNSDGDLLIPNLLHYYGNRVGIDDKDIPLDHDIGATEKTIAPPYRGGVIVAFPVRRVQSVAGSIAIDKGGAAVSPAYGQIVVTVGERRVISPLDEVGNFYLEDLAPGSYPAEVQYAEGACNFPLVVPAGSAALVDVGAVKCTVTEKETK